MFETGDGHKHGCLDAFTIALGSYLDYGGVGVFTTGLVIHFGNGVPQNNHH